ncbi:MAG: sigma-54-dependent Fis family transcriptional regulator, partial [Deltaproteobacteria bacterium HGW-Deltaproteobacteria-20]
MSKVLVVDDQRSVCTALELLFEVHGLSTVVATSPEEALDAVANEDVGVIVQDMNFTRDTTSGNEGASLMRALRKLDPDVPIILMTAYTSLEMAVQLIKEGANDYIAKPWDDEKLVTTVKNLMRMQHLQLERLREVSRAQRARVELARVYDLCGIVYASAKMHAVLTLAVKVAPADAPVLITGPNGSGKEKIAEVLQANSRRKGKPFVRVNAGGLPDNLLEAELFGAEAGAYTGASKTRIGRFEQADGGTLFLDEIGNLSPSGQMKLLRVLQTGEFQRLGSSANRRADVRIVSATNTNLPAAIARGDFREDLFFRLNVIEIAVPPLRDRTEDILPLAEHFLRAHEQQGEPGTVDLSEEARQALLDHEWPGNVRELENRIQRAMLVRKDATLVAEDLGLDASVVPPSSSSTARSSSPSIPPAGHDAERAEVE